MLTHKIHSEIIDIQGYFTIAVYVNYFIPGSLKIHTDLYTVRLGQLRELIDNPLFDPLRNVNTRRWLPKGEAPFPGYCRAPGSGKCIAALCNCDQLKERWNMRLASILSKTTQS
ncbi:uncharacterized protein LOC124638390 [Helicoverpa zea]|uniref:uncharacterized protein LOC124638390 n=1 Tax=Helicoverpa zea TaxID=7113 RepID=UPI001F566C7A|nr:uncharacterized protein LOC124638390 [Helicoverpa zea]